MNDEIQRIRHFPHRVKYIENMWIPMRDGIKLATRVWLPENAAESPVPAIVEYIPYRKRDIKRIRDSQIHPYFAGHGYACLRVDLRGAGDSEGLLHDEYLQQELDDGLDILSWLEQQPWCNGKVGIIGISWGGFNGLQIAALRPPQLKAIITICSSDDRYTDDIHHMGGCLLGDNLSWSSIMYSYNSLPPDPLIVGERWRDMWFERLKNNETWLHKWLEHQFRDAYWKHGSICEDYTAIEVPVYAVGGWTDGYTNTIFRLLENLKVPRKGLVGPWGHKYPHLGIPGPAIDFLKQAVRWWDHWLKDIETGIMQEPMLNAWMQDSVSPAPFQYYRPGRWVAEQAWPSANIKILKMDFSPRKLLMSHEGPGQAKAIGIESPLTVGLFAGKWCSYGAGPDLSHDQRQEDGGALVFDSTPLAKAIEILGSVEVDLQLESNKEVAMVAVRLSDIAEDGKVSRVTYGLLNLTHRKSNMQPKPLVPGKKYRVTVKLNHIAHIIPVKHRLRVAISTSYWPLAWPAPEATRLTVFTENCQVKLPVRQSTSDEETIDFDAPCAPPATPYKMIQPSNHNWHVYRDLAGDASTLEVINNHGVVYLKEIDLTLGNRAKEVYRSIANDFNSVQGEARWVKTLERDNWSIKTVAYTKLTSSKNYFYIHTDLDAYENASRVFCHSMDYKIKRNFL